jgi:hypothetical protein
MRLSKSQIADFKKSGYLFIPEVFTLSEVKRMIEESIPLKQKNSPDVIWEEDNLNVRALMGCHLKSDFFKNVASQPRVLEPSRKLLNSEVYIYQFKINLKTAFKGEIWPWHQDYVYWHELDGMPFPDAINMTIFLDDCTEFNGPLWLIPGSQTAGILDLAKQERFNSDWAGNVAADLTYQLTPETISRLVKNGGLVSPKGKAGSVLIFHPNIAHASLPNISPFERKILIITYNSVMNIPTPKTVVRPEFFVGSDTSALRPSQYSILEYTSSKNIRCT